MTPIDDELRAALHGRAQHLAPAADPLAGIERRAKRIQRNRIGAAVAGSALAVAAIAVAVPALQGATSTTGPRPPAVASAEPTLVPAPVSYALDPTDPWEPRGEPVDEGTRATIQREYATRVQGAEVLVTPLFAQVYEPSQQLEVVFLAEVDGAYRWGVAQSSESGPEFLWDQSLAPPAVSLAAALPGDEVARLLVVASPESSAAFYGFDDASEFVDMAELAPGVSTRALEGDPATDQYRVDLPGEQVILPAPDPVEAQRAAEPANLLPWPGRGTADAGPPEQELLDAFTEGLGDLAPAGPASYRPLFTADTDGGVRYTFGQAWIGSGPAYSVGLVTGGDSGPQVFLGPVTPADTRVLAFLLCCEPGTTTDTLVVVPEPGTGQVLYAPTADAEPVPVGAGQDFLDGVVLVDRDRRALDDGLTLLDGDGDLSAPTFVGPVSALLCGIKECG